MDRWKRFVDWCQQPSRVKVRTFNPRNVMLIVLSVLIISLISSGAWLYRVLSIASTPAITRDNYEELFPTLIVTENTSLTEDHFGEVYIEADGVTLDGNGHTITGPGVWMWNSTQRMWDVATGIDVKGRTGVTIKNCWVTNFAMGLMLDRSDGCTLLNNTVCDNIWGGIFLQFSFNNTLLYNTAHGTRDVAEPYDYSGFGVEFSFGNIFKGNVAYDNGRGFQISDFEKEIFEAERGFTPEKYDGNIFEANTAKNNTEAGFWIGGIDNSFSNTFFHNNLIDNAIQAAVTPDTRSWDNSNIWDDGYPSGGNYWSDYDGVDADGDGISDTPYDIPTITYSEWNEENPDAAPIPILGEPDGNNVDRFPLMAPFDGLL